MSYLWVTDKPTGWAYDYHGSDLMSARDMESMTILVGYELVFPVTPESEAQYT